MGFNGTEERGKSMGGNGAEGANGKFSKVRLYV